MKYRSRIDIISQILDAANGSGGTTGSKIADRAFLNSRQLKENLTALIESDLLRHDGFTQTFRITETGLKFLKLYDQINDLIKEEDEPS
ncbi:MAG: winged helix-turn-helix domain-containing protein [Nitrososphaera sp.]|jgi:predicted transcriptional regulator